jgi:hypothetical protein
MAVYDKATIESTPVHITSATTTNIVVAKRCLLRKIIVNTTAAGLITVKDGASGNTWAILPSSAAVGTYTYDIPLSGLTIVTGAAYDLTVVYAPLN